MENQPNEICSHLSEKASKGRLFGPDKLQNYINKGKGKKKTEKRGGRKEHKLRLHKQRFGKIATTVVLVKMKFCYDQGCNDTGAVIATK